MCVCVCMHVCVCLTEKGCVCFLLLHKILFNPLAFYSCMNTFITFCLYIHICVCERERERDCVCVCVLISTMMVILHTHATHTAAVSCQTAISVRVILSRDSGVLRSSQRTLPFRQPLFNYTAVQLQRHPLSFQLDCARYRARLTAIIIMEICKRPTYKRYLYSPRRVQKQR